MRSCGKRQTAPQKPALLHHVPNTPSHQTPHFRSSINNASNTINNTRNSINSTIPSTMFTPNLAAFFSLLASTAAAVSFDISHIAIWHNATDRRQEFSFTVARTPETSHGDGHGPHKCRIEMIPGADHSCYSACDDTKPTTFYTRFAQPNSTKEFNVSVQVLEFHPGPVELGEDKGILNNATFDFPEAGEEDNCEGEDENFFACLFDDVFRVEAVEMNPAIRPQNVCK